MTELFQIRQWDVIWYDFGEPIGRHPAVVISTDPFLARRRTFNVLKAQTLYSGQRLQPGEVYLNSAENMERPTRVVCDEIHLCDRRWSVEGPCSGGLARRIIGHVEAPRRKQIKEQIISLMRLNPHQD